MGAWLTELFMNAQAAEVAVAAVMTFGLLGPLLWGLIDAGNRPRRHWDCLGRSKWNWIFLMTVGTVPFGPAGPAVAIYYLWRIRPQVRDAARWRFRPRSPAVALPSAI